VSIATAYFTRMSEHASAGDLANVRKNLSASLRTISLFMVLATIGLVVVAYPFSSFFTRSAADPFGQSVAMGDVLIAFLIGLPAFSILFVILRAFYALGDTRTPFFVTLFQAVIFAIGAFATLLFVPKESIGVAVALTLSISGIIQSALAAVLIRRRLGGVGGRTVVGSLVRYVAAAIPPVIAGLILAVVLGFDHRDGFGSASVFGSIVSMVVIGIVMSLLYLGSLKVVRSPELNDALTPLLARIRR
jgi:putative peptidoglycan lipid II flippase